MSNRRSKIRVMPNPWPPDDIYRAIGIGIATPGLAYQFYRLILFWIEKRAARKIKMKVGEIEIEIQGSMSNKEVERAFQQIRKLKKEMDTDDVKIIIPKSADPSLSIEMARNSQQKEIKK